MAVGIFSQFIKDSHESWRIGSAGLYAEPGYPAAQNTLKVLQKRGVELRDHRSQMVTPELIAEFQVILTMEKGQKEALRAAYPQYARKILLFAEIVGENKDIIDPIGRSLLEYEDTAREMISILSRGFDRIKELTTPLMETDEGIANPGQA